MAPIMTPASHCKDCGARSAQECAEGGLCEHIAGPATPPCPNNWERCDFCGAHPNQPCQNPDNEGPDPMSFKGYFAHETLQPPAPEVDTVSRLAASTIPPVRPLLIGVTGYKRSGKDTTGEVMASILGCQRIAFADPIKDAVRAILRAQGVDEETIEECIDGCLKEAPCPYLMGKSPRYVMQTLGTEWGRGMLGDTIWVKAALNRAANSDKGTIITDVRFPNEAEAIREAGGVVVRVSRPETEPDMGETLHPSEAGVDQIEADYVIRNDLSRDDFQAEVAAFTWRNFLREDN